MKTRLTFRFPAFLVVLFIASLTSCKKGNEVAPAPDLAARVAGTYTYSELTTGGKTYPASDTNLKGTITLGRQTATTVSIQLAIINKTTNETFADDAAEGVSVTEASNGNVELRYQGNVIAKVNGSKVSIEGEDEAGTSFTLTATK
ncbi:hypothetical protein GCM10028808_36240 [Spirosoma migulaei]